MISVADFFPHRAPRQWHFRDVIRGVDLTLDLAWRSEGARRVLELTGPPEHRFDALFDRMTVDVGSLALNRIRMDQYPRVREIEPPLVITLDDRPNQVDVLLRGFEDPLDSPPFSGRVGSKRLDSVEIAGLPGTVPRWRVKVQAYGHRKPLKVLDVGLFFVAGLGLIRYEGNLYLSPNADGNVFKYVRPPEAPVPPGPPEPEWVDTRALLGLERPRHLTLQRRDTPAQRGVLRFVGQPGGTVVIEGHPQLVPAAVAISPTRLNLTQVALWGRRIPLDAPMVFADRRLDLRERPEFGPSVPGLGLAPPNGRPISHVVLSVRWSSDVAEAPWATSAGGPYADLGVRYLHFAARAYAQGHVALPVQEQVLALHEGAGPVRVVNRVGDAAPVFWDLAEAP